MKRQASIVCALCLVSCVTSGSTIPAIVMELQTPPESAVEEREVASSSQANDAESEPQDAIDVGDQATLIWGRKSGGELSSFWVERSEGGAYRAIETREGAFFIVEGALWRWQTHTKNVPLYDCNESASGPGSGRIVRHERGIAGEVVRLSDGTTREVMPSFPWPSERPFDMFQSRLELLGTLGPYLIAELRADFGICGLDDSPYVSFRVFDMRDGTFVEIGSESDQTSLSALEQWLFTSTERATFQREDRRRGAIAIRRELEQDGPLYEAPPPSIYLTGLVPIYRPGVGFELEQRISLWWCLCDGCGDGEWAGCTSSVSFTAAVAPQRLADLLPPSDAADWLSGEHPEIDVRGISPVNAEDAATHLAAFTSAQGNESTDSSEESPEEAE